ncbi:hypothetical protein ONS95_005636 [Cadophora gregata]|uniref:uncharacterized protein n=1 Tax=Cadophora gregata TaxID=51156 RepID=UPI0026DAD57E|nr:uncharacterized protein ONS95_005636 [Cadophora gregata]KAK0103624.1 hypothetical protein ONS95_005636 [Cadophora gregata]KAK0107818.1 hypothetical protein ONS96_003608 [Cadophora gregata f. sp. sojae]
MKLRSWHRLIHRLSEALGVQTPPYNTSSTYDVRSINIGVWHCQSASRIDRSVKKTCRHRSAADNTMRVLLLGGTGRLGLRCTPALIAHGHILTVYVRNPSKLRSLISIELLDRINAIVEGDATDVAALKKAIIDHKIEGIVDVAGNQVLPWHEYTLSKIAKAIADAAVEVGKERGRPLRIWVTSALGIMKIPGKDCLLEDYVPKLAIAQHDATHDVIEAIPTG